MLLGQRHTLVTVSLALAQARVVDDTARVVWHIKLGRTPRVRMAEEKSPTIAWGRMVRRTRRVPRLMPTVQVTQEVARNENPPADLQYRS